MQFQRQYPLFIALLLLLVVAVAGCGAQPEPPAEEPPAEEQPAGEDGDVQEEPEEPEEPDAPAEPDEPDAPTSQDGPDEPAEPDEPDAPADTPGDTGDPAAGSRLQTIQERGTLICGVNGDLPGFSECSSPEECSGFDADFCRVVAVAIFDDSEAVEFRPLNAEERFAALRNGEIDVLFRNTTWTASRDNDNEQLDFGPTTFHDGQGFMTRKALNITTIEEMAGRTICVQADTTSASNLNDYFQAQGLDISPLVIQGTNETYAAYDDGACDIITSDRSQLAARRTELETPGEHFILGTLISREPLGPVLPENDSAWSDVVNWAIFATIRAEELDISSVNVAEMRTSDDPHVRLLLGVDGTLGADLGIDEAFARNVITQVGNYAEIYERNLGADTPIDLERGPNKAWNRGEGGVLSSPPFR